MAFYTNGSKVICEIIGNVGSVPTINYTQTGYPVCDLNVAVSTALPIMESAGKRAIGPDGKPQYQISTTWYKCVFWRENALRAQRFIKAGTRIVVDITAIGSECWHSQQTNKMESRPVFTVGNFQVLSNGITKEERASSSDAGNPNAGGGQSNHSVSSDEFDDDIPF